MPDAKTTASAASVADYLASRASDRQRADCETLMEIFQRITRQEPVMWGPSIVGYGSYQYVYESGRSGESFLAGFAIRGSDLVIYLAAEGVEQQSLLARLGKHKMGKGCLYFKRLADIDPSVLEQLIEGSVNELQRRYAGKAGS